MRNTSIFLFAVLALAACTRTEASAAGSTDIQNEYRMGNKGPFSGRSDGIGFDVDNKGAGLVTNSEIDAMFNSSLYVSIDEDFLGLTVLPDIDTNDLAQGPWNGDDTATAGCPAAKDDYDNGAMELLLDNGSEVGDCDVNFGNYLSIDSDTEPFCVFRLTAQVAPAAADTLFWGFTSAQNDLIDSTTVNAGFSVAGADLNIDAMSDDNSTDVNATDTTADMVAGTMYEYMVSMNSMHNGTNDPGDYCSPTNVCFFIRTTTGAAWTRYLPNTTFSIGLDKAIQPAVHIEKTSGTTTPDLLVDRIRCAWQRE
jgi:hypothetical protein